MKARTQKRRCWEIDPVTQEEKCVYKDEIIGYTLEDSDREQIVLDIMSGRITAEEAREQYKLASINSIYSWIGKYMSQKESVSLQNQTEEEMANKSKDDQIRELKAALKKAQKQAEYEALRAHAYDKMIDLAEEHFNIPIRKKSGTKR